MLEESKDVSLDVTLARRRAHSRQAVARAERYREAPLTFCQAMACSWAACS
jgi:hypothetical protein